MYRQVRIILLLLLSCLSLNSYGQQAAQARKVLDKAASIVGRRGGASANYKVSGSKLGAASGTISIKGNKFVATSPNVKVWFDGKTQWTYMRSTNEINISKPTEAQQMAMNPYKFITMYKNGYKLSMTSKGGKYVVHLVAQNRRRSVPELYITLTKRYLPQTVKMRQGKRWTTIYISNFRAKNLPDSMFRFNAKDYPHAEVIDLR